MSMQPATHKRIDPAEFARMKKALGNLSRAVRARKTDPGYAAPYPEEIGIQLTYRCNIRCDHCFQWNDKGFFRHLSQQDARDELSAEVFEKILFETREARSNLYLWGGEPTVHKEWDALSRMIETDPRWSVICTNGLMLERKLESILRISAHTVLLVSLDGFQAQNDAIRGQGTFEKIIKNIHLIRDLQKRGEYKGKLSISLVLSDENIPDLYEFAEYCESLGGVDSLYLVYPWYITEAVAKRMDAYYRTHFSWLRNLPCQPKPSWHSYTHHVTADKARILRECIDKLTRRAWNIRLRLQPALEADEFEHFIMGAEYTGQRRSQCLSISNRMDVLADGSVSSCKLYPEFGVGNLYQEGVLDIWHGENFRRVREILGKGLTPACSKCVLLYLHGH
uniref:Radical SAM superfamily enzyme, MoaA/NifB/PqqE/SkfB family n=1 Tax=Candidatus Kentrum sp. UNK TaxID=2126344 RepID=A0A451ABS1_9GAMM|nr:MAG: Radical SAM superfamily enzyme, MoaA/NifB/PqqE/SkfB family [Candidatus Kentron sp. UNK]VFK70828.1 MAG: Radical SAM superfamily enzyme, MoaA/NifB/PqqE/SkfB family [Candidatus Kentron sp. UNK]